MLTMKYYPPRYLLRRYEILRHVRPGKQFLEIGAGGLELSLELLNVFATGKAIDFSRGSLLRYERLANNIKRRLQFELTDIDNIKNDTQFDCIVSCEVMEHIEDDKKFLAGIFSRLKSKGQVILSVPAHGKFWSIHDEITGHIRRYERNQLLDLLKTTGFENIQVIAYGFPFINMLRWLRVCYATRQAKVKRHWDRGEQTRKSGIDHLPAQFSWLGLLINPCTFLPLNWLARLFNKTDLSEGYIVVADKPDQHEKAKPTPAQVSTP